MLSSYDRAIRGFRAQLRHQLLDGTPRSSFLFFSPPLSPLSLLSLVFFSHLSPNVDVTNLGGGRPFSSALLLFCDLLFPISTLLILVFSISFSQLFLLAFAYRLPRLFCVPSFRFHCFLRTSSLAIVAKVRSLLLAGSLMRLLAASVAANETATAHCVAAATCNLHTATLVCLYV